MTNWMDAGGEADDPLDDAKRLQGEVSGHSSFAASRVDQTALLYYSSSLLQQLRMSSRDKLLLCLLGELSF